MWTATVAVVVLGGYYGYAKLTTKPAETRYVTSPVEKGTLVVSVGGSGQVSSSNQIDIKPEASGRVTRINVKNGSEIAAGAILLQLDASDALKAVRDAQSNLDSAKLSLEKLKQPADDLSLLQAQNAVISAQNNLDKLKLSQETSYQKATETKQKAQDDLPQTFEDAFNSISDTFLDLPGVVDHLQNVLYSSDIQSQNPYEISGQGVENADALVRTTVSSYQQSMEAFIASAQSDYQTALSLYNKNFSDYKAINRYASNDQIETLLIETIDTVKSLAQASKSSSNMIDTWVGYRTQNNQTIFNTIKTYQSNLSGDISSTNSHLSGMISVQQSLKDKRQAIADAERDLADMAKSNPIDLAAAEQTVKERQASLENLKKGPDAFDLQSQQLSITQRQNALWDAQQKLADYTVRAPIAGVITNLDVRLGENVSSGTAAMTLVAQQKLAEISVNEVDAAKIKAGQKATLTFDAVQDLTISGAVSEVDLLGSVSQGVVSYNVKIAFDTQDERIKPGMSVSAAIIVDAKPDVLLVPNTAVKTQGQTTYVEILKDGAPVQQTVQVGLSNDTSSEVTGIDEGAEVITQTITGTTAAGTSTQQRSGFSVLGGGNAGFRAGGFGR